MAYLPQLPSKFNAVLRIRIRMITNLWIQIRRQKYRYGSGSFYLSIILSNTVVRKTLIPTVLWLHFIIGNDVNVPSKSKKQNKVFVGVLKVYDKNNRIGAGSISQRHGFADPDPYQKCHGSATLVQWFVFWITNHQKLRRGRRDLLGQWRRKRSRQVSGI